MDRILTMVAFIGLILALSMFAVSVFRYKLNKFWGTWVLLLVVVLAWSSRHVNYVDGQGMWVPIICVGVVMSAVVLLAFWKCYKNTEIFVKQMGKFIAAVVGLVVLSFVTSWVAVGGANYAFDDNPARTDIVEIIGKDIAFSSRMNKYELKTIIDGEEKIITVPRNVYYSKKIGDNIEINLYNGALGYNYYIYE